MIIHNPTDVRAPGGEKGYPIEHPKTKEVHEWAIEPGETLDFPDYVGEVLIEVYQFLQRVVTKKDHELELEEKEKVDKGRHFERVKIVDSISSLTPPQKEKVEKPETLEGFTSEEVFGDKQPEAKAEKPAAPEMSGSVQAPAPARSTPSVKPDLSGQG